jgi:hypothetical protein
MEDKHRFVVIPVHRVGEPETSVIRGASPLGLPYTLSRAPLRRRAPFPPPLKLRRDLAEAPSARRRARGSLAVARSRCRYLFTEPGLGL